jgi:hypothetical protein
VFAGSPARMMGRYRKRALRHEVPASKTWRQDEATLVGRALDSDVLDDKWLFEVGREVLEVLIV